MSQSSITPDLEPLITEDDEPVDNIFSEKQQRLLTEPLYSSWAGPGDGRTFVAMANVGVFYIAKNPAIVPDALLSLDVELPDELWGKEHRSYFLWEYGKPPDVVVEVVSNKVGQEDGEKLKKYARMRVVYYIIFDPELQISDELLRVYRWADFDYIQEASTYFPKVKLGLTLWEGEYENFHATWLRWADEQGNLIPTGKERAEQEKQRAEQEKQRAEQEKQRAEQESKEKTVALQRAEKLAARLREAGLDPDKV
ncbi:MAG: Uma2 family endonuclease [Acidobacteria bacterium]|nr:Uma2 family endonuclease [Acidobacteriota bacterium]